VVILLSIVLNLKRRVKTEGRDGKVSKNGQK